MNAKPLLVVLAFLLFLVMFAGGSVSNLDLTPDTPYVPSGSQPGSQPVTGGVYTGVCGSTYTVRTGDTLSRIAQSCGLPLETLLASNPTITNANLIKPGQVLTIFIPPTAAPSPTPTAAMASPLRNVIPDTGLRPGGFINVDIDKFPANNIVNIEIGLSGGALKLDKQVQVDENGSWHGNIAIPGEAKPGEKWIIVITSNSDPNLRVTSPEFEIQ